MWPQPSPRYVHNEIDPKDRDIRTARGFRVQAHQLRDRATELEKQAAVLEERWGWEDK